MIAATSIFYILFKNDRQIEFNFTRSDFFISGYFLTQKVLYGLEIVLFVWIQVLLAYRIMQRRKIED